MTMKMMTLAQNLMVCLLLSCCCHNFRPVHPFVFQRIAYPKHQDTIDNSTFGSIMRAQSDPENNSEHAKTDKDKVDDPMEELLAMQEAARRVNRRLNFPRTLMTAIGESIRFIAIGFLIFSFSLNVAGYALIRDGDSLRIGTLEDRDFQMEITKSMKEK